MVRLTNALMGLVPHWYYAERLGNSFFRKQALFYMNRFTRNRAWSVHKTAVNRYHWNLKIEQHFRPQVRAHKMDLNRMRIDAACQEHGYCYQYLKGTLPKIDVNLDLRSLAHLAVYEPRTFKSLVDISREIEGGQLPPANFNEKLLEYGEFNDNSTIDRQ